MAELAKERIMEERKKWRKDHPYGFIARPQKNSDGAMTLFQWECLVPAREKSIWAPGKYKVIITFSEQYPLNPPKCTFSPPIMHPNVYDTGIVCLSLLSQDWAPAISVKDILVGIQTLLDEPNPNSPAQHTAYELYTKNKAKYIEEVKKIAQLHANNVMSLE